MKAFLVLFSVFLTALLSFAAWFYVSTITEYDSEWQSLATMPMPRSEIAAAALDQQLHIAGGIGRLKTLDAFERYDIANNYWEPLTPLPATRHHVAMATLNGEIYAVGGFSTLSFKASANAWAYSPPNNSWRAIAPLPEARGELALVKVGDSLYVVAGSSSRSQEVWKYSLTNNAQWAVVGQPMPTARDSAAAVVLDKSI